MGAQKDTREAPITPKGPLEAEMLQLLRGTATEHNFRGILLMPLEQRLTTTEIAERMNIDHKSVAARIKGLRALFNEELPTPGDAIYRARDYQLALSQGPSKELRSYIMNKLSLLNEMDPRVKLSPSLSKQMHGGLAASHSQPQPVCPRCDLAHAGDCW